MSVAHRSVHFETELHIIVNYVKSNFLSHINSILEVCLKVEVHDAKHILQLIYSEHGRIRRKMLK